MRFIGLLILLLGTFIAPKAQNTIGLPEIVNYQKGVYKAGAQNRQILQDKNGVLYFANNEGVLTFDGKYWKVYPLPNKSIVRSIAFGPDGKLYAGGQDEFGYFAAGTAGQLVYRSLKEYLPREARSFTDVWNIAFFGGGVFFHTTNRIYQVNDAHCTVYKSNNWGFLATCGTRLLAQDYEKGLLEFSNGTWSPLSVGSLPPEFLVTSAYCLGADSLLLASRKHGLFLLKGNSLQPFQSPFLSSIAGKYISGAIPVNKEHIAVTTNLGGCYIIDRQGALVQDFSTREGLQNNNILHVFLDRERNLWLGLDNGIDLIAYNNAIKHIYPEYLNASAGYASIIHDNYLYIGTADGLYRTPLDGREDLSFVRGYFEKVANTNGQVWNLSEVAGHLLLGHHDGSYEVKGNTATRLDHSTGFWNFFPFAGGNTAPMMIAGTYNGLSFFGTEGGRITPQKLTAPFESARFVIVDGNQAWSSHPYKGVFRVSLASGTTPIVKQYGAREGVTSINGNYIFRVKNHLVLTTENGILEYNALKDVFEPSPFYNTLIGQQDVRYLKEDGQGNIWFVFDKSLGVIDFSGTKPHVIYLPELTNKMVSGFEQVYPVNENNVFVGGEKGFYHINYALYKKNSYPLQVQIRNVRVFGRSDSLLFGGYAEAANEIKGAPDGRSVHIDYARNSIHFEYTSPTFGQLSNIEYSYFLEGFDKKWSDFSPRTEKEYTNLPEGDYVFHVKVHNNLGTVSSVTSYRFSVLPPWYRTWWAYILYAVLALAVLLGLYRKQKQQFRLQQLRHEEEQRQLQYLHQLEVEKFEEEQKRMQYLHQLELEKNEKEIIRLKNEKLETEIQNKNTELASTAMHLVQKGERLTMIKDELQRMNKNGGKPGTEEDLKKIIRVLIEEERINDDWEQFAVHFNNVHSDYLVTLKEKHPKLSAHDLKLCAYLRMNLTSKEVAKLLNISVRGVELSRYRLRKKLGIPTEVNLFDYLFGVTNQAPTPGSQGPELEVSKEI